MKSSPSKQGRPTLYSETLAEEICLRIAEGAPLTKICKDGDMPGYTTVQRWRGDNPDFRAMYARAREDAADTLADEIITLARRVENGELNPHAGRVVIDALKWIASKLKPREYGERHHFEMSGKVQAIDDRPSNNAPEWLTREVGLTVPTRDGSTH